MLIEILLICSKFCHRSFSNPRPTLVYDQANSNLVGQSYCTFPMGKPMIVCNNVPTLNEWPSNFQPLF